jgi:hypothetical protein
MKTQSLLMTAALLIILLPIPSPAGAEVQGMVRVGGGYLAHPMGHALDEEAGYLNQSLRLILLSAGEGAAWRAVYEGSGYEFESGVPLGQTRHALGVEWFGSAGEWGLRAGLQAAGRFNESLYSNYDYREGATYVSFKHYLAPGWLWRGSANLSYRRYSDLPEESYFEHLFQSELQRFLPTRTTLGVRVALGGKSYLDDAASRVWLIDGTPNTHQVRFGLQVAQGLGARYSVRLNADARVSLNDFPHLVLEDVYDSPLIDAYASQGGWVEGVVRMITPWQTWTELGVGYGEWDYGDLRFAAEDGGAARKDQLTQMFVSLERQFRVSPSQKLQARIWVGYTDQQSDLVLYDLDGASASTSLAWSW